MVRYLLLFFSWLILLAELHSQSAVIGVPSVKSDTDLLNSEAPVGFVLRSAATSSLIKVFSDSSGRVKFLPGISSSVNVNFKGDIWKFTYDPNIQFSNGRFLSLEDIQFSLDKCSKRSLKGFPFAFSESETGFELKLANKLQSVDKRERFIRGLSNCPIVEKETAQVFESYFGKGTNFVGTGDYYPESFIPGRGFELERNRYSSRTNRGPKTIKLREFGDDEKGLVALQYGNIDVLFLSGQQILGKASKDKTLESLECGNFKILKRKSAHLECGLELKLATLSY